MRDLLEKLDRISTPAHEAASVSTQHERRNM